MFALILDTWGTKNIFYRQFRWTDLNWARNITNAPHLNWFVERKRVVPLVPRDFWNPSYYRHALKFFHMPSVERQTQLAALFYNLPAHWVFSSHTIPKVIKYVVNTAPWEYWITQEPHWPFFKLQKQLCATAGKVYNRCCQVGAWRRIDLLLLPLRQATY